MWTPDAPLCGTNKGIWGIDPDESETKTQAKRWAMAEQFKFWNNEWRYLDKFKIGRKSSVIDQPLLMTLLIAARAYMGNTKFDDLVYKLNSKDYNPSKSTPISRLVKQHVLKPVRYIQRELHLFNNILMRSISIFIGLIVT